MVDLLTATTAPHCRRHIANTYMWRRELRAMSFASKISNLFQKSSMMIPVENEERAENRRHCVKQSAGEHLLSITNCGGPFSSHPTRSPPHLRQNGFEPTDWRNRCEWRERNRIAQKSRYVEMVSSPCLFPLPLSLFGLEFLLRGP